MGRHDEMVELIGRLGDGPDVGMPAVVRLKDLLDQEVLAQVGGARRSGWSWARIGSVFGVTAQAVHKRFAWLV